MYCVFTEITAHGDFLAREPPAGAHIFRSKVQVSVAVVQDKREDPFLTHPAPEPRQTPDSDICLAVVLVGANTKG